MASHKHIFIHTGEVSGDLQGALLVQALLKQAQVAGVDLKISAIGGERMAQAGANLVENSISVSAIGIFESIPHYAAALKLQRQAKAYLKDNPPDLVVLIDYMGPNIAIGNFIRKAFPQTPMVYYIAPQQWVWSYTPKDTERILKVADKVLAIFPEEARYYEKHGGNVVWVGHPLIDQFGATDQILAEQKISSRQRLGLEPGQTVITLLPASRKQELTYVMPVMFAAAQHIQKQIREVTFLVPVSRTDLGPAIAKAMEKYGLKGRCVEAASHQDAIATADLVLTKSGTANLEIALMNVPQVVMYRLNPLTAQIGKWLNFSCFISPVNLVEMEAIVPEFVQWDATPEALSEAVLELLLNSDKRQKMLDGYAKMRRAMGEKGVCDRTAQEILAML